ncbi:MAG: protein adenylyltransferase SelO [Alphaproteobacteria bacterium]
MLRFFNSYYEELTAEFYQQINPQKFPDAYPVYLNDNLAEFLEISAKEFTSKKTLAILSGNKIHPTSQPIAMAYAGHQFGNFVKQLGDGRAILLGEIKTKEQYFDLQLKGCGKTKFSRLGDGLATLGSAIRELIIGEALHYLDVPSTRILSVFATNYPVIRQEVMQGAVMARIAKSHIRIGTFEYLAFQKNIPALKKLANYAINRHFPELNNQQNNYLEFFKKIVQLQAKLIAKFQTIGFIHGVMNTDNTAISGQAIDFGPCAFLDEFNENKVFSAIDSNARYAYKNQILIAKWNLFSLANCLNLLVNQGQEFMTILDYFDQEFHDNFYLIMSKKLGFKNLTSKELITKLFEILQKNSFDYSFFMRQLSANNCQIREDLLNNLEFKLWHKNWLELLHQENRPLKKIVEQMNNHNPFLIARNHLVEEVINDCYQGNFKSLQNFLQALAKPFTNNKHNQSYSLVPSQQQKIKYTFCQT